MNYFERLLARAVAVPAKGNNGEMGDMLDDPFEHVAPWELEAPDAQTVQRKAVHREYGEYGEQVLHTKHSLNAPPAPVAAGRDVVEARVEGMHKAQSVSHGEDIAEARLEGMRKVQSVAAAHGEDVAGARVEGASRVQPALAVAAGEQITSIVEQTLRQQTDAGMVALPRDESPQLIHPVRAHDAPEQPITTAGRTYLNQDDPLADADAFMQSLSVPGARIASRIATPAQTEIEPVKPATFPASPQVAPSPRANERMQPPTPEPHFAAHAAPAPSAAPASPFVQETETRPSKPERMPEPPPANTIITVAPALTVVEQYAQQLGAIARFGIGQL